MNLGLVNVNEETFNFKRVTRTEIGMEIIVLNLFLFCIRDVRDQFLHVETETET